MTSIHMLPSDDAEAVDWLMALVRDAGDVILRAVPGRPTPSTHLRDELGIDSVGVVSLFYAVLDALAVEGEVEENQVASWETLGDVLRFARTVRSS